jgi:DNA-binding CsgD family transcriptional regulator
LKSEQPPHPSQPGAPFDRPPEDALRVWLVSGIHKFAVDPRRRLGSHARARQLLTQDFPDPATSAGKWQSLASTLDRHTVLGGMTELSPQERRVLMLAYLEGCTNREIAIGLGLSAATVRRLLRRALKRIDTYLTQTGTWIYAILLLGAGHVVDAATRLGRSGNAHGSAEWTYKLVSTAAVSTVTAAVIGVAGISPDSSSPPQWLPTRTVHAMATAVAASMVTGLRATSAFDGDDPGDSGSNAQPSFIVQVQVQAQTQNQGQGQNQDQGQGQAKTKIKTNIKTNTKAKADNAKHDRGGKSTDAQPPAGPDSDSTASG